jgi:hypothetical protein
MHDQDQSQQFASILPHGLCQVTPYQPKMNVPTNHLASSSTTQENPNLTFDVSVNASPRINGAQKSLSPNNSLCFVV